MDRSRRMLLRLIVPAAVVWLSACLSPQERAELLHGPYTLHVNYSASLSEALDSGRYAWVNRAMAPANFPAPPAGTATLTAVLVSFSAQASLDYVQSQAPAGMRPATLWELLEFGSAYPQVQQKLPVMALGSSAELVVDTYEHFTIGGTMQSYTRVVPRLERLYPFLAGGLPGRMAGLEWLGDPAGYGIYYALFVKPA